MRWILTAGMASLVLIGPAVAVEDVDGTFAKLPAKEQAAVRELLDLMLPDGPASRLRQMRSPKPQAVCGAINTRNKMGAYIGYKVFMIDLDPAMPDLLIEGSNSRLRAGPAVDAALRGTCGA